MQILVAITTVSTLWHMENLGAHYLVNEGKTLAIKYV